MRMDGDEARGLLRGWVAKPLDNACGRYAIARGPGDLETDEFAILGVTRRVGRNGPFLELLLVDRVDDAPASIKRAEDAEQVRRRSRQMLDSAGPIGIIGIGALCGDARQNAVADPSGGGGSAFALDHKNAGCGTMLVIPRHGAGNELTIRIARRNLKHGDGRQTARAGQLTLAARNEAFIGHVA